VIIPVTNSYFLRALPTGIPVAGGQRPILSFVRHGVRTGFDNRRWLWPQRTESCHDGRIGVCLLIDAIMVDLYSFLKPQTAYLLMGGILFSAAVFSTFTGKVSARFSWVYRAKEPIVFWFLVAAYYLAGVCFIGYFLYKGYGPSN